MVIGAKGKDGEGRKGLGLSARGLRDALLKAMPGIRVLIIDAESKDSEAARRVLRGEVEGWDVVICTPVAQSGVSWVGAFAQKVFVAGGRTLPPDICGGQAGRRERTATTCVAYVPNTAWDQSLSLWGREAKAMREELRQAREQAADQAIASGREIEVLERVYVLAAQRQIEELALFRDHTLDYAAVDGWATEELAAVEPLPRAKGAGGDQKKRTEPVSYRELDPWRELLLSAGLGRLYVGKSCAGDHKLVKAMAEAMQTPEAARVKRNAVSLQVDLKGTGAKPARTIGTVVFSLGVVSDAKKAGPRGAQQQLYRWVLPGER